MSGPNVDPRWAALESRAQAVRRELDRLDAELDLLPAFERAGLLERVLACREALDQFDTELATKVAGL
jgi:hypothetical protein